MAALVTTLNAATVDQQLATTTSTLDNLSAACQGILATKLAPSSSHWYGTLSSDLQQVQGVAQQWLNQYATQMRAEVLTCVVHCGQAFGGAREQIDQLFAQAQQDPTGVKAGLQAQFTALQPPTQMVAHTVATYEAALKSWGQRLQQAHDQMKGTVKQIQDEQASLQAAIAGLNAQISSLQAEIIRDRQTIARAKAERDKGIVETIFGVLFAPFTGGLSLILAGIGVSSIVEAESKVAAMQQTIEQYQMRIIASQQNLTQDQAQVATLQALLFPAGIALSDTETGAQYLDSIRTSWEAFFQELGGVITKITNAQNASAIIVEQAWWGAACKEWDLIVTGAQGIIGQSLSTRSVTCTNCQVPVIRVVPTGSHPAFPSDLKETVL
ncbi:MAG TPA: hypothetical protein VK191_02765, partial [Symbiobacteriaceae bacterium]|nr:hypothetical protein [Symbiobacteriaceae bacterium]